MRMTRLSHLLAYLGVGALASYAGEWMLTHGGHGLLIPPWSLAVVLVVLSVAILVAAWPVWRSAQRGERGSADPRGPHEGDGPKAGRPARPGRLVDPFYAVRVLGAARAVSRTGAVLLGGGCGLLALIVLPPIPSLGTVLPTILGTVAAALLLTVCGYLAERACRLPPSAPGETHDGLPGGTGATSLDRDAP